MSGLINPHTGAPMNPQSQYKLSQEDLLRVLTSQRMRIDMLNQQNMQMGLYVEFIVENLLQMTDANGEHLFDLDVSEFPAFAERRMEEIQQELAEHQAEAEKAAAAEVLDGIPQMNIGSIDLNE